MRVQLAHVTQRAGRSKNEHVDALVREYIERAGRLAPVQAQAFDSEAALLAFAGRASGAQARAAATLVLLDSRGDLLSSTELAHWMGQLRDAGTQRMMFGIGPADGWSAAAREQAHRSLSFGRITLPHELARVVAAEQIYRALTILAGHPYHCGH